MLAAQSQNYIRKLHRRHGRKKGDLFPKKNTLGHQILLYFLEKSVIKSSMLSLGGRVGIFVLNNHSIWALE